MIIWSLKTSSNWSVQMVFLILGNFLQRLLSKSEKLIHVTLWDVYYLKKIVLSTHFRVLQKYWVDSWWVIAMIQSVMGVLSLDWQPTQRLCPHKITSEIHETRCSRSCCHWSCKQWKLFLKKSNMYFFSIKFVIFHIISI